MLMFCAGHGKSEGITAYVPSFDALADDTISFIEHAKSTYPGKKLFLHGYAYLLSFDC